MTDTATATRVQKYGAHGSVGAVNMIVVTESLPPISRSLENRPLPHPESSLFIVPSPADGPLGGSFRIAVSPE
jgi:hypothetical protein